MENNNAGSNQNRLKFDFSLQIILIWLNIFFTVSGVAGLIVSNGILFVFVLLLQILIGFVQFGCSALPRAIIDFKRMDIHRKVHFVVGLVVLYLNYIFSSQNFGNSYMVSIIMLANLLFIPQILLYYYFWITWRDYEKMENEVKQQVP